MVIPMKGQYEQKCNAAALEMMGVPVIKNLKEKHFGEIGKWLESDKKVEVDYPDQTQRIIGMLFAGNSKKVIQMTPFDYQKYHTL